MEAISINIRIDFLRDKASKLTVSPGVYLMKDESGKIIYVGKAKALKNRVISYFRDASDHSLKTKKLVEHIYNFDFIVTGNEFEALVLECSLIKQYTPKYNILLKDDKGYHYIKIDTSEYPRITTAKNKQDTNAEYIGPYTGVFTVSQAVDEANRIFMLPTCTRRFPQDFGKERPCLNYHIKRCSGVCMGKVTSQDYREQVNAALDYIKSGSVSSVEQMTEQMEQAAGELDFERAAKLRDRIAAIQRVNAKQRIIGDNAKDFDLIALAQNGESACVSVILYRDGRLTDKDDFFLGETYEQSAMRKDFLMSYYSTKSEIPREVYIDDEVEDIELIEQYLRERVQHAVTLSVPKRGEMLKHTMMAKANASEYLSLRVGRTGKEITALDELGKLLGLQSTPIYIEAYDISNLGETAVVGGMVVFENGRPLKSAYRRFSVNGVQGQNDYASMAEVLERRFKRYLEGDESFSRLPDLILLDGGKGQVGAVEPILAHMDINVPLFGMVKDARHRTRAIALAGGEIAISRNRAAFSLVTRIQDEVHRFAIEYQRKRHSKTTYELELTKVKGIGQAKATAILKAFKTKAAIKQASIEQLREVVKVSDEKAQELYDFIQQTF